MDNYTAAVFNVDGLRCSRGVIYHPTTTDGDICGIQYMDRRREHCSASQVDRLAGCDIQNTSRRTMDARAEVKNIRCISRWYILLNRICEDVECIEEDIVADLKDDVRYARELEGVSVIPGMFGRNVIGQRVYLNAGNRLIQVLRRDLDRAVKAIEAH